MANKSVNYGYLCLPYKTLLNNSKYSDRDNNV